MKIYNQGIKSDMKIKPDNTRPQRTKSAAIYITMATFAMAVTRSIFISRPSSADQKRNGSLLIYAFNYSNTRGQYHCTWFSIIKELSLLRAAKTKEQINKQINKNPANN